MNKQKDIPCIFYFYLHSMIKKRVTGKTLTKRDAKCFMAEWRIPKTLRPLILKELEMLGLFESNGRHDLIIKNPEMDVEDISKLYEMFGIF